MHRYDTLGIGLCVGRSVPRGGFGCSGLGRELGIGGLHEYTELKSVNCESIPLRVSYVRLCMICPFCSAVPLT